MGLCSAVSSVFMIIPIRDISVADALTNIEWLRTLTNGCFFHVVTNAVTIGATCPL
jgi:hypothetical protein